MLLFGVVNHTLPAPSSARKIGWFPLMLGSVKKRGALDPAGSSPIWPVPALAEQVGAKSQPGSANQTLPAASIAVPHGSPTPPAAARGNSWMPPAVGAGVGVDLLVAEGVAVGVEVLVAFG